MIVEYSLAGGPRLLEANDFNRFKVVLRDGLATSQLSIDGVTFTSETEALVAIDLVSSLPGAHGDAAWTADYANMIKAARSVGWVDEVTNEIRAHVEWTD